MKNCNVSKPSQKKENENVFNLSQNESRKLRLNNVLVILKGQSAPTSQF